MNYINISEKIFNQMDINEKNFAAMDANDWLYFLFLFFEHTAIFLDIENLSDDCLKKQDEFFIYIASLSERRENVNVRQP